MEFKTKEESQAFIRRVMGPPKRTLVGKEREHMLTLFALTIPVESSNNQTTCTDVYNIGGKMYHATYGDLANQIPIIEEIEIEPSH
jgi:hypothetical protein